MDSIVLLIIFLIFRTVIVRFLQPQKIKRPTTSGKRKKHQFPTLQDLRPKTTSIKAPIKVKIKPDILSIPVEEKHLKKIMTYEHDEPGDLSQLEPKEIPALFTQDNILRGIIMQEVLSPPKAIAHRRH